MSSPPTPTGLPRGRQLPRAAVRARTTETRIIAIDWAWVAAIALIAAANAFRTAHSGHWGRIAYVSVATLPLAASFAYLSALVLRDRYAAVVAGCLTATSVTLATVGCASVVSGVAIACLAAVWLCYDRGQLVVAAIMCGIAAICRPEMVLLGVILTAYGVYDKKEQAGTGAATYIVILLAVATVLIWRHRPIPLPNDFTSHGPLTVLWASGPAVLWFMVAFLTDLFDKHSRPRWLPIATWLVLFLIVAAAVDRTSSLTFMAPAFVGAYIIAAAGIARVLPAVAGDHGTTVARYVAATMAVLLLLCLRYPSDTHAALELVSFSANVSQSTLPASRLLNVKIVSRYAGNYACCAKQIVNLTQA